MANFTNNQLKEIWKKAATVEGFDSDLYRKDIAGAWIQFDQYGKKTSFGWEVDHMFPKSKLTLYELSDVDNPINLQPLQWKNNETKGDDFPEFSTSVSSEGKSYADKHQNWKYNDTFIKQLKSIYPNNPTLRKL